MDIQVCFYLYSKAPSTAITAASAVNSSLFYGFFMEEHRAEVMKTSSATNAGALEFSMLSHAKKQVGSSVMVSDFAAHLLSLLYFACNSRM